MSNRVLKICLLADYPPELDEGMVNIAFHLSEILSTRHQVKRLSLPRIASREFWSELKHFDPDVIHYIPGPSIFSLAITKVLKAYCDRPKTVVSAVRPVFFSWRQLGYGPYAATSSLLSPLIPLFKPDMVLVQSERSELFFQKKGCTTTFVPSGVDTSRFIPASPQQKRELRHKHGVDLNAFVIIHVGPLSRERNVQLLTRLQDTGTNAIFVGSTKEKNPETASHLRESGCLVWNEYISQIEEFYQLADCYIFPTIEERSCIEIPLSVLEAMSCNLPVISTRFAALPRLFGDGHGFAFASTEADFMHRLRKIKDGVDVATREMVLRYSWENVSEEIEMIYMSLLDETQVA